MFKISLKTGHLKHYIGKAIKKRHYQTLQKQLPPVAKFLGINHLHTLLIKAKIDKANQHVGMEGHGVKSGLNIHNRKIINNFMKKAVHKQGLTYNRLNKECSYSNITGEILRGSRDGIIEIIAWLTVQLGKDYIKPVVKLLEQVQLREYEKLFLTRVKYFEKD